MTEEKKTDQTEEKEKARELRKKLAASGVAVVTSASLLVGGLFNSPAALVEQPDLNPVAVVDDEDDLDGNGDGGDGPDTADGESESEQEEDEEDGEGAESGVRAGLRQKILQLPYSVRLLVILPLWAIGYALIGLGGSLWASVLSPVLGKVLAWLLFLGALLGSFLLAGKAAFPDLPLKKILNKRSLSALAIGAVALGAADLIVPLFWDGYDRLADIVRAVGGVLILGGVSWAFAGRELRRRRAEKEAAERAAEEARETEAPQPRPVTREDVLALADTVSRPRRKAKP